MAINFPDAPVPGQIFQNYVWDGEKWLGASSAAANSVVGAVRYDAAQGLTSAQMSQGRANIAVTKKNYIVNGGMQISQENGATAGTVSGYYPADTWSYGNTSAAVISLAQITAVTPGGCPNRVRLTVSTADTSVAAGDVVYLLTKIEGLRSADLVFGTAAAKTVTLQFGCKGPAGTYCVSLTNSALNRTYVAEYVIASGEANTDIVRAVTVPGDVTGTWLNDSGVGISIRWCFMAGTTFQSSVGWTSTANVFATANQFNFAGAVFNVFELFDVSLTEGSVAPPFQLPDYATELALCKRYWWRMNERNWNPNALAGSSIIMTIPYSVEMRAGPAITFSAPSYTNGSGLSTTGPSDNKIISIYHVATAAGGTDCQYTVTANARL